MTRDSLIGLAERFERANAAEEYGLLREAWDFLNPGHDEETIYARRCFIALLDAGGFVDAALSLVPEGFEWVTGYEDGETFALVHPPAVYVEAVEAATQALALCAAALRARAASTEQPS